MAKYTWPTPDRHSSAITSVRMRNEAKARISGLDNYATADTRDAALAEVLATTSEVFNVKAFGAIGDGVVDDTAAIQAAIDAASVASGLGATYEGAKVVLAAGSYLVSSDLVVPIGVSLIGAGARATEIVGSGTFTDAVVTSGVGSSAFIVGNTIEGIRVKAGGADRALRLGAWNENCTLRDVHVLNFAVEGVRIEAAVPSATRITQNTVFERLRITTSSAAGADGLVLDNVRQCTFLGLSIDQASAGGGGQGAWGTGIKMLGGCNQNIFQNVHLEDCNTPIEMGEDSSCSGNVFIGLDIQNPHFGPADITIGATTAAMAIATHQGSVGYTVISYRNNVAGYDYDVYDEDLAIALKFASQSSIRFRQFYSVGDGANTKLAITASSDAVDVTGKETVRVSTSGGDVVIGGLTGGIDDQQVDVYKTTQAGILTIEHNEGSGDQKIITPGGRDMVLHDWGGVRLRYDGTQWFAIRLADQDGNFNVKDFGATGDGTTDDTAAIQAAIDASSLGSTIVFPDPSSTYSVTGDIKLKGGRQYIGNSGFNAPVSITLADGSDPSGILVSEEWYDNGSTAGNPIIIKNLRIDGNKANNASGHGLLLSNFRCLIDRLQIRDCKEDGIRFSQATRDASDFTGTAVESYIGRCFVYGCDGYGFRAIDTAAVFTDGWLIDNIFAEVGIDTVRIDHATGWLISGNHTWGVTPGYGLHIRNCDHTRIIGNYIERYGSSTTPGSYEGILAHCFENVIVADNHIKNDNDVAGNTYHAIRVTTASGVTARALVTGNQQEGNTTDEGIAVVTTIGGGTMNAFFDGNQAYGVTTGLSFGSNVNYKAGHNDYPASVTVPTLADDATPTIRGASMWKTGGTTTVTDLDDGVVGQTITILSAHAVTITDGTNILLNGSAPFAMAAGDTLTLTMFNDQVWEETSRKVNL